jgi:tellurite resistance protein TerC
MTKHRRSRAERILQALHLHEVPAFVRRVIVAVIGGTVLLIGLALLVLPGPAILVIPLGLAILATEFVWARRWLRKARTMLKETKTKITG